MEHNSSRFRRWRSSSTESMGILDSVNLKLCCFWNDCQCSSGIFREPILFQHTPRLVSDRYALRRGTQCWIDFFFLYKSYKSVRQGQFSTRNPGPGETTSRAEPKGLEGWGVIIVPWFDRGSTTELWLRVETKFFGRGWRLGVREGKCASGKWEWLRRSIWCWRQVLLWLHINRNKARTKLETNLLG